jgi:hypothetical protein
MSSRKTQGARCSFWEGGHQCRRNGHGNPRLCDVHAEQLGDIDDVDVIVDAALDRLTSVPQVKKVLAGAGRLIDQLSGFLDRAPVPQAPAGGSAPPPPRGPSVDWRAKAHEYARRAQEASQRAQRAVPKKEDPRMVLGFPATTKLTKEVIKARHRELSALFHPDKGGSLEAQQRITAARDELLAAI